MAERLTADVVARLKARAQDPSGRSDIGGLEAGSVREDEMIDGSLKSDDPAVREYLEGMNTPFAGMISNMVTGDGRPAKGLFGMLGRVLGTKQMFASMGGQTIAFGRKSDPRPAPPPCSEAEVAAAEVELGFALPPALRQFYLEVANGGVGPGGGLYSLNELRAKWREFTTEPIGPRGQKWPAKLLPIHGEEWDVICINRDSGELIQWDVEEIDYGGWKKSFVPHADGLEAWLGAWLGKPIATEKAKRRAELKPREPRQLTDEDWQVWGDESPLHREYLKRLDIATMTPTERAAIGLTEDNWAEKMWDGLEVAGIKFPTPGYAQRRSGGDE